MLNMINKKINEELDMLLANELVPQILDLYAIGEQHSSTKISANA